jgi:hypothetical protein
VPEKKPSKKAQPSLAKITAYHGSATSANRSSPRQSNTARAQVLKSRRSKQKSKVTASGTRIATGPLARNPRPMAANVAYNQPRRPVSRCNHAPNMEAAISRFSSASAVAARPMMYTPSDVASMAAARSARSKPK